MSAKCIFIDHTDALLQVGKKSLKKFVLAYVAYRRNQGRILGGLWGPGPPGVTKGAPKRKKKEKGKKERGEKRGKEGNKKEKKKKEGARKKKERKKVKSI